MKIRPTSRFIREQVSKSGEAILLLGVRSAESATRSASVARHSDAGGSHLSPHSDHKGVWIFSPIKDLTTDEVWCALINNRPPWGGTFVVSTDDAPSCGSNSARFGCWTCTVVEKDSSIESLIAAGHEDLLPLADFRNRLKAVSEDPDCRSKVRRNGQPGLGPLTFDARRMLLEELLAIQTETGMELISALEVRLVREQWAVDRTTEIVRSLPQLVLEGV